MDWQATAGDPALSRREYAASPSTALSPRKIYYFDPRGAGPFPRWTARLARVREMGFDHLCVPPVFRPGAAGDVFLAADADTPAWDGGGSVDETVAAISRICNTHDLSLLVDVVLDRIAPDGPLAETLPHDAPGLSRSTLDPRRSRHDADGVALQYGRGHDEALTGFWTERLGRLVQAGARGFRLLGLGRIPVGLLADLRRHLSTAALLAWTPGVGPAQRAGLAGLGLDGVFASTPWWDGKAPWYVEEHETLRRIAPVIAPVEAPFGERQAERGERQSLRMLAIAAATGDGLMVPMGFEHLSRRRMDARFAATGAEADVGGALESEISAANVRVEDLSRAGSRLRSLTGPGSGVTRIRRGEATTLSIAGDEVRIETVPPPKPIVDAGRQRKTALRLATQAPRIVIDRITPRVEGGAFAAKRVLGQSVTVEADVFMDGHDVLAVELHWRPFDEAKWRIEPMTPIGNDRWRGVIAPDRIGRWVYTVEAALDELATVRRALKLKKDAGVDFSVEESEEKDLLAKGAHRAFTSRHEPPLFLDVERTAADFASWYELFPRSITSDPKRHGTFDDVIGALPRVRDMGFDVLYFPPIHPIGRTNRKGRNNTLTPSAEDVGSAYAIGSAEGGHDALHPQLGTLADFRRLVAAAADNGLEIAIDFAIQCSPDHPWLKEHPDWFRHRPDGTIKYAENPPKKYEDIVNVDFYAEGAVPDLWIALRDIVLFWANEGVRIFRVDNPHTKPLPFWQWMIADVRGRLPDVIFLSEAFTRPKMMYRLAKVGFSQSYSYFTWRNTRRELTEYLTELTTTDVADYFRPNFFVNTPDINPFYLQSSGRPGFVIRAVLAATLSGLWGVYSGFELCEAAPLPDREEYLDSEKYEIRVRDFDAPGNIVAEIATLNRLRKAHPALQSHHGVAFYNSSNEQIICYGKTAPGHDDMIFALVSLDPHNPQETSYEIPLWHWGLPDHGALEVEDLVNGQRFTLNGKRQWLRLDPAAQPFMLWRLWRAA